MKELRKRAFIYLLIVSIIWGVAAPVIKFTGTTFTPALFLTYRFFLSSLVAVFYFYRHTKELKAIFKHPQEVLGHSFFTVVLGLGLIFLGFNYTDSVTGALLAATGPLFAIVAGAIFLKEKITKHEVIGLGFSLFGSAIITVPTGHLSLQLQLLSLFGAFVIILSRVFDAIGSVFNKESLEKGMNPEAITHFSFVVGFFVFSLISLFTLPLEDSIVSVFSAPLSAHIGVFYMAFISGTFAYILATKALKQLHIGEASMFSYITPLWATPVAVLWLKEPVTVSFIVGAIFIAVGVIIAESKNKKKRLLKTHNGRHL